MDKNISFKDTPVQNNGCLNLYEQNEAQVQKLKEAVMAEFKDELPANVPLLQLAANEAEALAWQTPYPHLFFPVLAEEKIHAVIRWNYHQNLIRQHQSVLSQAA